MHEAERRAHELRERVPPVLSNRAFRFLWLAQIISQTAQNAILYALIIVVLALTESTTSTSVVVLSFVVPTVAFGIFAGLLVDRWSKRRLIILTTVGRAVAALAFFFGREHVWALYTVTIFFASFSQLFTTSSAASIPFMVSRPQLISANSLFSGAFTIAQIAGLIVLSPIILKTAGPGPLFASAAGAFLAAAFLARFLPYIATAGREEHELTFPGRAELQGAVAESVKALGALRSDPMSALAMVHITMSSTLILLFAILVPRYMQAILQVDPEDAVAVFAPVAFGALFGLRAVPWVVGRIGKTRAVALGMFGIALCLGVLGFVETIAELLERTDRFNPFGTERVFGLSILVALTMLFAGPMGFAYAMINTPAQTTLHERTPIEMRGRVIASQMVLANGVALIPLVVVGGIADLYGISAVVLAIGGLLAVGGALSLYAERRWALGDETPGAHGRTRRKETVPSSIDTPSGRWLDL
jgi:DHA3 family macrolide efflux protein-like MFS transporter